jgi:hypothetical protein
MWTSTIKQNNRGLRRFVRFQLFSFIFYDISKAGSTLVSDQRISIMISLVKTEFCITSVYQKLYNDRIRAVPTTSRSFAGTSKGRYVIQIRTVRTERFPDHESVSLPCVLLWGRCLLWFWGSAGNHLHYSKFEAEILLLLVCWEYCSSLRLTRWGVLFSEARWSQRVDPSGYHLSLRRPAPIDGYSLTCRTCRANTRTALLGMYMLTGPSRLAESRVRVTLQLTVSRSVCLGVEPTLWTFDQILLPSQLFGSEICCLVCVGRPLWRETGSVLCKSQSSNLSVCTFTIYICHSHIYYYIYIYTLHNTYNIYQGLF